MFNFEGKLKTFLNFRGIYLRKLVLNHSYFVIKTTKRIVIGDTWPVHVCIFEITCLKEKNPAPECLNCISFKSVKDIRLLSIKLS